MTGAILVFVAVFVAVAGGYWAITARSGAYARTRLERWVARAPARQRPALVRAVPRRRRLGWRRGERLVGRRLREFEEAFPDALSLVARGLRAGHALAPALEMVVAETTGPVAGEFRELLDRYRYGVPLPDALGLFTSRVPLLDARLFATAVLIQRESGGNLAEVLDNLASVARDRFKVRRQVRVISAQGRLTGWILVALPPVMGAGLAFVNPAQMSLLVSDPTGRMLLAAAVALQLAGTFAIRRIVRVEY